METFNPKINPSSIVDILTLRYDPSIIPNLPKKHGLILNLIICLQT